MGKREVARDYLIMAYADAVAAMGSNDPYSICFHCQQEVEKYLKAFLAYNGKRINKTHDLDILLRECISISPSLESLMLYISTFRPYAVDVRYQASKSIAEKDCPIIFNASMIISRAIKELLPADLLDEANKA